MYEGEHTLIRRRVAIKCLHAHYANSPEIVARFHREALAATSIGHPNIIECTDMGRFPDGAFFMVVEFLDGRDWSYDLERTGPQPVSRVEHIMTQVCDALSAAHDKGVVHRDLKPENIYLIKRGNDPDFVKVLDFGISKIKGNEGEGDARSKGLTRTGMPMGTPYYMAPEQGTQGKPATPASDRYALGILAYELLSGRPPFDGESALALMHQHVTTPAPRLSAARAVAPVPDERAVERLEHAHGDERDADEPWRAATQRLAIAELEEQQPEDARRDEQIGRELAAPAASGRDARHGAIRLRSRPGRGG